MPPSATLGVRQKADKIERHTLWFFEYPISW
jgi:hypothetical protein